MTFEAAVSGYGFAQALFVVRGWLASGVGNMSAVDAEPRDEPLDAWVKLGREAYGLTIEGRIAAVVYYTPSDVGEQLEPGAGPTVLDCGYYLVDVETPWEHECIATGSDLVWEDICERASREFIDERVRRRGR